MFEEFASGKPVTSGWPRIPYDTAIAKYGSDKPDLRNPIEMEDVTEHFRGSGFKVFAGMIEKDPKVRVWAIPAPTGGSRAFCDRMNAWAQKRRPAGPRLHLLARGGRRGGRGPRRQEHRSGARRRDPDAARPQGRRRLFFAAGDPAKFYKFAGLARDEIGRELKLVDENRFAFAWIVDFPFYEWNEDEKKIDFSHNPFSMPKGGREALEAAEKEGATRSSRSRPTSTTSSATATRSRRARCVTTCPRRWSRRSRSPASAREEVEERFGGLYRAFQYGAPPHGGMAAGIERIVMLLTGARTCARSRCSR